MSLMHKTDHLSDPQQMKLLEPLEVNLTMHQNAPPIHNKVFLYDVSQPFDQNDTREALFRKDLSDFMGFDEMLKPLPVRPSGSKNTNYAIDICDDKFIALRGELMTIGRAASKWIRWYFMEHADVTVSSPEHFKAILRTWMFDPCDE
jgi:hypothetical protein